MDTFGLKIIASDRVFYEGRCRKLVIPAPDGEKGILPNHENMVIAVKIGMARMEIEEGNWVEVAFVIFIVSFTLLMRLCISLIFAILTPALLEFLCGLHDLFDQFFCQYLFLFDFLSDFRII